jgi:hypothetical protein
VCIFTIGLSSEDLKISAIFLYTSEIPDIVVRTSRRNCEVAVNLRPTVCLGVRRPSGTRVEFFFSKFLLDSCGIIIFVAPSLNIGRVCKCTIASGTCQSSHSWAQVPQNSRPYFTVSSETPPTGGPGSRIYIPQEQGGPVIPPGTGFPFCRLLRLAGTTVEVF